jgi:hypothetical protein
MAKAVLKCDSDASIWALQVPLGDKCRNHGTSMHKSLRRAQLNEHTKNRQDRGWRAAAVAQDEHDA